MSTTVSYKGATIATVSNQTKTLLTEGKYLEDDLTLTDVSGGGAVLTTKNISANGTYNASSDSADGYSQVNVAVPASAVDSGTKNITANGNGQDVVGYASVDVAVPNSYSASDEGKVVSNGALVAQTAHADVTPTTSDQTIDTTLNNSLKVKGDADLVASNIKKDVEIFGVTGSYEGGGGDPDENLLKLVTDTLTSVELDMNGSKLRERAFNSAKALLTARIWNLGDSSGQYVFYNCTNLQTAVVTGDSARMPQYFFGSCASLTKLDLAGGINLAYGSALNGASSLNVLVIRDSSVMTLGNTNVFTNTPFASGKAGGTLYVPQSLLSQYTQASNWSTILGYANNSIKSIESTHTDPTAPIDLTLYYADGTPISS